MPRVFWALALALGLVACAQVEIEPRGIELPAVPLSVEDAVALALVNHPDARIAEQLVLQAASMVDAADSAYWPELGASARFTRTNRPSMVFGQLLDQGRFDSGLDFNDPGTSSDVRPALGAGLTLYDGGRRRARVERAAAELDSSVAFERELRDRVAFETARAWYGVHESLERGRRAGLELRRVQQRLEQQRAESEAGSGVEQDVRELEFAVADARLAAEAAEDGQALSRAGLRLLLGLGQTESFELAEPPAAGSLPLPELEAQWVEARFARPELVRAQAGIEAALAELREREAGYWPELSLAGEFGFNDPDGRLRHSNWLFGAGLVQSITEALRTPQRVRRASAGLRIAHERGRAALLEVEHDVERAWIDAAAAERELEHARGRLEQRERDLAQTTAEREFGAARSSQLLDDRLARDRARIEVRIAELRQALARTALEHATGRFPRRHPVEESEVSIP